jgi:hypothetical protein
MRPRSLGAELKFLEGRDALGGLHASKLIERS